MQMSTGSVRPFHWLTNSPSGENICTRWFFLSHTYTNPSESTHRLCGR